MIEIILLCICGVLLTSVLTVLLRNKADTLGLVLLPNDRSSHDRVVPHGGGLGFVSAFLVVATVYSGFVLPGREYLALLVGSLVIAGVSLLDDLHDVNPPVRLCVHIFACATSVYLVGPFAENSVENLLFTVGATLGLVWFVNLFNFMDGIDSLAGIEGITVLSGMLVLGALWADPTPALHVFLVFVCVLAISLLTFLAFNWPPATIFMGDVGSATLGFVLGVLALIGWSLGIAPLWSFLILGGVFIVDASYTLLRRMAAGEKWWAPHNSHAYQCLSRYMGSPGRLNSRTSAHRAVGMGTGAVNLAWLLPLSILAQAKPEWGISVLVIAWTPLLVTVAIWSSNYLLTTT